MPYYDYACDECEVIWTVRKPMAEGRTPEQCPECEGEARKVFSTAGVIFKGDGWASKDGRINRQMAEKNRRLDVKQKERIMDGGSPGGRLVPNVDGERVDSWEEAGKLAKSKGKDASGYTRLAAKEKR